MLICWCWEQKKKKGGRLAAAGFLEKRKKKSRKEKRVIEREFWCWKRAATIVYAAVKRRSRWEEIKR